ncbi:MAG: hypothetical protein V9E85_13870 [Candidatus Nanopelagicales bacterium]
MRVWQALLVAAAIAHVVGMWCCKSLSRRDTTTGHPSITRTNSGTATARYWRV